MLSTVGPPGPTFLEIFEPDRKSLASAPPPRRAEPRIPKRMLVRLWDSQSGRFEITSTVDISCHGARVMSNRSWQPNEQLLVHSVGGNLYSHARVVHCRPLTSDSYAVGLELPQPTGDWTTHMTADTEFWAVRCRNCSNWVTNGLVESILSNSRQLPGGTVSRECDHCHTHAMYDLSEFVAVPASVLLPENPH